MKKYKVLEPDAGHSRYACVTCGTIHAGPFARQDAVKCCRDRDNTPQNRLSDVKSGLGGKHDNYGQVLHTGDGYTRPDMYGRWRLGRNEQEKHLVAYYRALYKMDRQDKVYSVKNFIETIFEPDGSYPKWRGKRSPLQRLAYAYHNRNWEQVKLCAYQLAYDDVVRKRLNEYFAYIKGKITEIDGMLDALAHEADAELDDKFPEIRPDPDDFNLN